jgi:tryptophan-rich hypothetical protein
VKTINPRKLLHSKWTAVNSTKKEKHFIITEVEFNEEGVLIRCLIEAVISNRATLIQWHELEDTNKWLQGWK